MRPSPYRLLATDLDGTLLDPSGRVHARDAEAIAELSARGVRVTICTGRMHSGMREIARGIRVSGPVACVDGSHIHDAESGAELSSSKIHGEASRGLRAILADARPATFLFSCEEILHDDGGAPFLEYVRAWTPQLRCVADVLALGWDDEQGLGAVVSVGSGEQIEGAERRIRALPGEPLQTAAFAVKRGGLDGLWGMIVRAAGTTKGTALEWIAQHHGIPMTEVVAVGDWVNDTDMLRRAGRSFVMAQAPDEVKQAATDQLVADHVTGGGIAEAARRAGML